jgi:hypothetical protein
MDALEAHTRQGCGRFRERNFFQVTITRGTFSGLSNAFFLLAFSGYRSDESSCGAKNKALQSLVRPAQSTIHGRTIMKTLYTIDDDNNINAFAELSADTIRAEAFATEKELTRLLWLIKI